MPFERSVATTTHGLFLLEPARESAAHAGLGGGGLLLGFHGYGEDAATHMEALASLPGAASWTLAAVQGLHLFYRRATQEVVASWMTRTLRETAIADNVAYVARVLEAIEAELGPQAPIVFTGFSQGAAMAYRAAARLGRQLAGLLVVGGDLPPDLGAAELATLPPTRLGRGVDDAWFTSAKLAADLARLEAAGVDARPLPYAGGHEWAPTLSRLAGAFLAEIRQHVSVSP